MRPLSADLAAALQLRTKLWCADLFTILTIGGVVYRWTSFDQPITYSFTGDVFLALGPRLQRSRLGVKNTVEVPELEIKISAYDTEQVAGVNFKQQVHNGYFDGASIYLDRLFMPASLPLDTSYGVVGSGGSGIENYPGALFSGQMSEATVTAYGAKLTVKGANVLMNQYIPKNVYQYPCLHTFCDTGCTLSAATFTFPYVVGAGPTASFIPWVTPPGNPRLYNFGVVTMTSGAANGQQGTVKAATVGGLYLQYPFYNIPTPGDTFNAQQGCNKNWTDNTGQSCAGYNNQQHFRGAPFTPIAETAF